MIVQSTREFYHGKTQSRDAPRNARFHGISFLFLPLQANIHRNSLLRKPYPFDILLTEKRSACFVASAPFVVPVIHFCFDFRSRHILSALSRSPRGWAKTEKNSLMHTQSPINPTRSTRRWTAVARRPDCPPLGLPPDPQRPDRNRTAPPPSPWPSPRGQGPGG